MNELEYYLVLGRPQLNFTLTPLVLDDTALQENVGAMSHTSELFLDTLAKSLSFDFVFVYSQVQLSKIPLTEAPMAS